MLLPLGRLNIRVHGKGFSTKSSTSKVQGQCSQNSKFQHFRSPRKLVSGVNFPCNFVTDSGHDTASKSFAKVMIAFRPSPDPLYSHSILARLPWGLFFNHNNVYEPTIYVHSKRICICKIVFFFFSSFFLFLFFSCFFFFVLFCFVLFWFFFGFVLFCFVFCLANFIIW